MSKRCKLQSKYFKQYGKCKKGENYTEHYVKWLEDLVIANEKQQSNETM